MPLLELHFSNLLELSSFSLLSYIMLMMHIPIVFGFGASTFYIIKYLRKYYGDRPIPAEWRYFWLAIMWTTVHQIIEVLIFYQLVIGKVLIIAFIFTQLAAGIYLIRGTYLLFKKYQ